MKNNSTSKMTCSDCKKKEPHIVLYSKRGIAHLLCPACGVVNPFSTGTSGEEAEGEEDDGRINAGMDHADVMKKQKKKHAPYAYTNDYAPGDCFRHKIFGDGYVLRVLPSSKMIVLFSDEQRLLRCGPGSNKEKIIQFGTESSQFNITPDPEESRAPVTAAKKVPVRKVGASSADDAPRECPKCGKTVHPYNLTRNPSGRVIACMNCKGQ